MTVHQLDLVPLPAPPSRGKPLVACRLPIEPQVAQRMRARAMNVGGKWLAQVYDDANYKRWKSTALGMLIAYWSPRDPIRAFCIGQVVLVMARPPKPVKSITCKGEALAYPWPWTSGRLPHAGTEDLDNLRKGPLDVLVQAGVIADDRLIVEDGGSRKVYAAEGEEPCVEVRLWQA